VWLGVMAGPDGWNSIGGSYPGGTWVSPVTPMTDFPVSNSNPDSMFLFGRRLNAKKKKKRNERALE
jgi:hypothetical protein